MASIYEIAQGFYTLLNLIEDESVEDEVILDAWNNQTESLADKIENCCKYIKNEEAEIAGFKEEEKRLKERRQAKENGVKRLKDLMYKAQKASGEKKLQCGTFTTSIQANPPSCVIDTDLSNIPEKYLIPQEPTVDKKSILADLKDGADLDGIAHIEQGESLRIR